MWMRKPNLKFILTKISYDSKNLDEKGIKLVNIVYDIHILDECIDIWRQNSHILQSQLNIWRNVYNKGCLSNQTSNFK